MVHEQSRHHPHFQYCISDPSLDVIIIQCTLPVPIQALPTTEFLNGSSTRLLSRVKYLDPSVDPDVGEGLEGHCRVLCGLQIN
jgi:hypothetical protein